MKKLIIVCASLFLIQFTNKLHAQTKDSLKLYEGKADNQFVMPVFFIFFSTKFSLQKPQFFSPKLGIFCIVPSPQLCIVKKQKTETAERE